MFSSGTSMRFPLLEWIASKWWFWQCCILHHIICIHIKFIINLETEYNTWRKKCKKRIKTFGEELSPQYQFVKRGFHDSTCQSMLACPLPLKKAEIERCEFASWLGWTEPVLAGTWLWTQKITASSLKTWTHVIPSHNLNKVFHIC